MKFLSNWQLRPLVGLILGAILVYTDNFAFQGEVSPIVIVILLLISTIIVGILLEWSAWITVVILWICVPMAHVVKHLLGLPDTLHPNTYTSILMLAAFTLIVSATGFLLGVLIHRIAKDTPKKA